MGCFANLASHSERSREAAESRNRDRPLELSLYRGRFNSKATQKALNAQSNAENTRGLFAVSASF
jgi:hypothetical protein